MTHKALVDLEQELANAAHTVNVGGRYVHYKHPQYAYEVKGLVILEATDEIAVRYASADRPTVEFVRPLASWLETVAQDGKTLPRFTEVI